MKADIAIDTGKITGFWRSSSQHIPSLPGDTPPSMQAKHHPFLDYPLVMTNIAIENGHL